MATIPNRDAIGLILAPLGRDAPIAASLLLEAGVQSETVADVGAFVDRLGDDIALAVVTEEALRTVDLRSLSEWTEN